MLSTAFLMPMWATKRANPVFWFVIFQWIMAVGTFSTMDISIESDALYVLLFFLALISFGIGSLLTGSRKNGRAAHAIFFSKPLSPPDKLTKWFVFTVALLSTLIMVVYYRLIGYNLLFDTLTNSYIQDFKSARLATYSGQNYYAPGFVNQFKNSLLVLCWTTILTWMYFEGRTKILKILVPLVFVLLLYSLLGTGQRAPMVFAILSFGFGLSLIAKMRLWHAFVPLLVILLLFGMFSVMNGRTESFSFFSSIAAFGSRIFTNDQQEGLFAFSVLSSSPHVWFKDWIDGLLGLSPWHKGSTLTHDLFFLIHGTARGTAGITTVGSAYYNGGVFNVAGFYFLMGLTYSFLYRMLLSGPKTVLRCYSYGGIFFLLSVFVSGGPVVLINKGILALAMMLFIGKLRIRTGNRRVYTTG